MSGSRRQDRERKKREKARRRQAADAARAWSVPRLEDGQDPTGWPIERTWSPLVDAWSATGEGSAAILRRRPDGRFAGAFFGISMTQDGLTFAGDLPDAEPGEFEGVLRKLGEGIPPYQEGPPEVVSGFVWGAYASSVESGRDWDQVPKLKRALALVAKPPGTPRQWADALWDDSIPAGLKRVLLALPDPETLPEGKEAMVVTTATFEAADPAAIATVLRKARPDFGDDGREGLVRHFTLTRPYPKGHWSPLAGLGGRQIVGRVEVHHDTNSPRLVAEGKTLSMTCVLIQRLKGLVGDAIRLVDTTWADSEELMRRARAGGPT
jgi:hypothetical protein